MALLSTTDELEYERISSCHLRYLHLLDVDSIFCVRPLDDQSTYPFLSLAFIFPVLRSVFSRVNSTHVDC